MTNTPALPKIVVRQKSSSTRGRRGFTLTRGHRLESRARHRVVGRYDRVRLQRKPVRARPLWRARAPYRMSRAKVMARLTRAVCAALAARVTPGGAAIPWSRDNRSTSVGYNDGFGFPSTARQTMRILYFDCFNGASGDMILGALLDAGLPLEALKAALGSLAIEDFEVTTERVLRAGVSATKFRLIERHPEPVHTHGHSHDDSHAHGHDLPTELRVLALHGLLHLMGYDHERDEGRMRRVEERLRRRAGLPSGLIARPAGRVRR